MRGPSLALAACVLLWLEGTPSTRAQDAATDLPVLLEEVRAASPTIAAAKQRISAARFERTAAGRPQDPMLDIEFDNWSPVREDDRMMMRYALRQPIPTIGMLGLQRDVADAMVAQSEQSALETSLDVVLATTRAFVMLRMTEGEIVILERQQRLVELVSEAALARMRSGSDTHHDILQSQAELLSLKNQLTILEARRIEAVAMINALRNKPPDTAIRAGNGWPASPLTQDPQALERAALAQRPELARMRAMKSEQVSMAKLMSREARPMFEVGAWYNQMLMMPDSAGLMVSTSLPLSGVKRQRALSEAANKQGAATESDLIAMAAMVRAQVRAAEARYTAALQREALLKDVIIPKVEQTLLQAQTSYRSGMMPYASVVQDRRMLAEMQMELVSAEAERMVAHAELLRAMGAAAPAEVRP
jgi:cobalt-zinc-cadmium efflux system outer membrane protein